MDEFAIAMNFLKGHEGGYQCMRSDAGNWTGGKVGAGILKGTNCGISAAQYPDKDIKNLSDDEVSAIYFTDYWLRFHYGQLPQPFDIKTFDMGVDMGPVTVIKILQAACNTCAGSHVLDVDGIIGQHTHDVIFALDAKKLQLTFCDALSDHYTAIAEANENDEKFLDDWLTRATDWPVIVPNVTSGAPT